MIITLLQQDICWANPAENIRRTEESILNAPESDLYVLPEMWSTGFGNPENLTDCGYDYDDCSALEWMQSMAMRLNSALAGSLSVKADDGTFRNRLYFVTPESVDYYDKRHLFSYGNEHLAYTAGSDRMVVEWRGVKFLLQICYDLRFPCFSRNGISLGESCEDSLTDSPAPSYLYDCALYVASWPTPRIAVWNTLLIARALENQCYVIGVNRVGTDPICSYSGGTMAIDAYGRTVADCPENEISSCTFTLDLEKLYSFRGKFPVLADGD